MGYHLSMLDDQYPDELEISLAQGLAPPFPAAIKRALLSTLFQSSKIRWNTAELCKMACEKISRRPASYGITSGDFDAMIVASKVVERIKHSDYLSRKELRAVAMHDEANLLVMSLRERGVLVCGTDIEGGEFTSLAARTQGTGLSRYQNMVSEVRQRVGDAAAQLVDKAQVARFVWKTSNGDLVVQGIGDIHGAVLFPHKVKVTPQGVSITDGVLVITRSWGHIHWLRISEKYLRWNRPDASAFLESGGSSPHGWRLRLCLSMENMASMTMKWESNSEGKLPQILPRTAISGFILPIEGVKVEVADCAGMLVMSGGSVAEARWFMNRLKGRTWFQNHGIANWLVSQLLPPYAIVTARKLPSCKIGQWATLFPVSEKAAQRRSQFLHAFPGAFPLFSPENLYLKKLLGDIDFGRHPLQRICAETGLPTSLVRAVMSAPWQRFLPGKQGDETLKFSHMQQRLGFIFNLDRKSMPENRVVDFDAARSRFNGSDKLENEFFLNLLMQIPLDWLPSKRKDWITVEKIVGYTSRMELPGIMTMAMALVRKHKGNWSDIYDDIITLQPEQECSDTIDWLKQSLNDVLGDFSHISYDSLPPLLFGSYNFRLHDVSRLSSHWHAAANLLFAEIARINTIPRQDALPEAVLSLPQVERWTSPTNEPVLHLCGGSAQWLTSKAMLEQETVRMGHCVWSYTNSCLEKCSHIAAITGADGTKSTIEIQLGRDLKKRTIRIDVIQHQGIANKKKNLSKSCEAIGRALVEEVLKVPQEHLNSIVKTCEQRRCLAEKVYAGRVGARGNIDKGNYQQRQEFLLLLERFFHRKWRGMGLEDFCRAFLTLEEINTAEETVALALAA